jgi:hypothetical protein
MANFQSEVKKEFPVSISTGSTTGNLQVSVIRRLKRLVKNGSDLS